MSRDAWLVCEDCKVITCLGKIVKPGGDDTTYFHFGEVDTPPNSEYAPVSKTVMKFLALHMEHTLRVWPDEMLDRRITDEYSDIGGDSDVSREDYIRDFPG